MKKSELYNLAMDALLDSGYSNDIKIEVMELLIDNRSTALFTEKREEEKNGKSV